MEWKQKSFVWYYLKSLLYLANVEQAAKAMHQRTLKRRKNSFVFKRVSLQIFRRQIIACYFINTLYTVMLDVLRLQTMKIIINM